MVVILRQNVLCVVLVLMGLFFIVCNIANMINNRLHKTHVSGIPFLGGLLIAIGFLTTPAPFKWLALLGFLDPTFWMLFMNFYYGKNEYKILEKRYAPFLSEKHFCPMREDPSLKIVSEIHYSDRETPHIQEFPFKTNAPFTIGYPWAVIIVTEKETGSESVGRRSSTLVDSEKEGHAAGFAEEEKKHDRFLVLDTGTDGNLKKLDPEKIKTLDFNSGKIDLHNIADYLEGDIQIRIEPKGEESGQ